MLRGIGGAPPTAQEKGKDERNADLILSLQKEGEKEEGKRGREREKRRSRLGHIKTAATTSKAVDKEGKNVNGNEEKKAKDDELLQRAIALSLREFAQSEDQEDGDEEGNALL